MLWNFEEIEKKGQDAVDKQASRKASFIEPLMRTTHFLWVLTKPTCA
jgi:hypothetical protein